jgi:copper chaperone CopZ|tara:strand:- start:188 stop:655 length:468 start_codon:yes stop_codon:yes gene_type:complete
MANVNKAKRIPAVKDWSDKPDKASTSHTICYLIKESKPTVFEENVMSKQTTEIRKNEKSSGCCCADEGQHRTKKIEQTMKSEDFPLHALAIKGAKCGGCVGKIERALQSVAGVEDARMNLDAGVVIVSGEVSTELLIRALEIVGFSATKAQYCEI